MPLGLSIQRGLILVVGILGLTWGVLIFPQSESSDELREFGNLLLHSEPFSPNTLSLKMSSAAVQSATTCDTYSQRAILLMEMRLAETAMRTGNIAEFDRRIASVEARARRVLSCTPRDALVWLVEFNLRVLRGQLDQGSFKVLAMSYETSPNEAWLSTRRLNAALPLLLIAPEPLQQKILLEFQQLVRHGFVDDAARSYLAVQSVRSLLQARVELLNPSQQKSFWGAVQRLQS